MANSDYTFGLDFYEGNSVRDWSILDGWNMHPAFAYFRAGIGLHKDNLALMEQCLQRTKWKVGFYYEVWLPDVPKASQLQTLNDQMNLLGIKGATSLPVAMAFELQTELDRHGNRTVAFPSVGDLAFLIDNVPNSVVYTNEDGLNHIIAALGKIPATWNFWLTFYGAAGAEGDISTAADEYAAKYHLDSKRILFLQTTDAGAYPAGASYDKGADYNRAVSFDLNPPPPVSDDNTYTVVANKGLNIRATADSSSPANIVGGLPDGSAIFGRPVSPDWIELHGFVSSHFVTLGDLTPQPIPDPTPSPTPPPVPPPFPPGAYYRIRHDEELPPDFVPRMLERGSNLPTDRGVPETVNLANSLPEVIDETMQHYIVDQMRLAAPNLTEDELAQAFHNLLGSHEAFTNDTGFATQPGDAEHADYINRKNLDQPDPRFDRIRNCAGNVVHVLDEVPVTIGGEPHLRVETINLSEPLPDVAAVNYIKTPWLVFRCTTVTPFQIPGSQPPLLYRCNRFPQLKGNDVPMIMATRTGFGFIPVARLEKVENPLTIRPYVP